MRRLLLLGSPIFSVAVLCLICVASQTGRVARAAVSAGENDWSRADAQQYLDNRAHWWLNWSGSARGSSTACISCHTAMPIAMALPTLGRAEGNVLPATDERSMIADVIKRVDNWDDIVSGAAINRGGCSAYYTDQQPAALGTESVMNSLVLVNFDLQRSGGVLSPSTRAALDYLWQEQQPDGSWRWLEFGLRPWESDGTYYGAALAALAVGMAGKGYYDTPSVRPHVDALRVYLNAQFANRPLHDQSICLWASTYLPGVLTVSQQSELVQRLLSIQDTDGGWSLSSLGVSSTNTKGWPTQGMFPAGSLSDGFATGIATIDLKRTGMSKNSAPLKKATAWLISSENSGSWPTNYINGPRDPQSDEGGFLRDASTGFAVLGLAEPSRK